MATTGSARLDAHALIAHGSRGRRLTAHLSLSNAVPAFARRFVRQEALPLRLGDFDLGQFFSLTPEDVAAIRAQFRNDHRLPAALLPLFRRVAGRPLDGFSVLPRSLPRDTAEAMTVSPPSIVSLRSI
jgi:hypothetical protein